MAPHYSAPTYRAGQSIGYLIRRASNLMTSQVEAAFAGVEIVKKERLELFGEQSPDAEEERLERLAQASRDQLASASEALSAARQALAWTAGWYRSNLDGGDPYAATLADIARYEAL